MKSETRGDPMSSQFIGVFSVGTTLDRGLRLYKLSLKRVFPVLLVPLMIGMLPYLNGSNMFSSGYSTFQILIIILSLSVLVSTEGGGATGSSPAASFGIPALIGVLIYTLILTLVFRYSLQSPLFTTAVSDVKRKISILRSQLKR